VITLGIETATIVCGVAIVSDGTTLCEAQVQGKNQHAENIMRLVDECVKSARVSLSELDAIAVSIGPGSFTGLRIGLSVAKGMCYALDKPLVAVPTLTALAQHAVGANTVNTPYVLAVLDARRDEVYCSFFRVQGKVLAPVWEERDLTLAQIQEEIGNHDVTMTGDALGKIAGSEGLANVHFVSEGLAVCSATSVAVLGEHMAAQAQFADVASVEPRYVKDFFARISH